MNPILQAALASILRWALAIGAGFLVKAGIWTEGDAANYVAAGALALLALAWSLYHKYKTRSKILTALTMPEGSTEDELNTKFLKKEDRPTITTPSNTIPGVPDTNQPTDKP